MDTISELRRFNRWRRGTEALHEDEMPSPRYVGRVIDDACDELERLRGEIVELLNVVNLLASPLEIDGPNHAAEVKRARSLLSAFAKPGQTPATDGNLNWTAMTDRMPNPDQHDRVLIYTQGADFAGEHVFDVKTETLNLIDDNDRLDPCPFCGAEAEIISITGETDAINTGAQCVQCTSSACGASSALIYPLMGDVTDLLMQRWNKRRNARDHGLPLGCTETENPCGNLRKMWADADKKAKDYRDKGELKLLEQMHDAWAGLKECGWKEIQYCPKDGTRFAGRARASVRPDRPRAGQGDQRDRPGDHQQRQTGSRPHANRRRRRPRDRLHSSPSGGSAAIQRGGGATDPDRHGDGDAHSGRSPSPACDSMKYETRVTALVVLPVGQPTFSEMATTVEIADEAAGEFVEVKQRGRVDIGKIQINPEEWPSLREAIDRLIAECRDEPDGKNPNGGHE